VGGPRALFPPRDRRKGWDSIAAFHDWFLRRFSSPTTKTKTHSQSTRHRNSSPLSGKPAGRDRQPTETRGRPERRNSFAGNFSLAGFTKTALGKTRHCSTKKANHPINSPATPDHAFFERLDSYHPTGKNTISTNRTGCDTLDSRTVISSPRMIFENRPVSIASKLFLPLLILPALFQLGKAPYCPATSCSKWTQRRIAPR